MHQSERVTSTTSGVEGHDGEEESDLDSWPEDSISPHDSKDLPHLSYLHNVFRFLLRVRV